MANNTLNQLMQEYLNEFNNLENKDKITYHHINNELVGNLNSIYRVYWNRFSQTLTGLDPVLIDKFCLKFKNQSPTIIFTDILGFYKLFLKKQGQIIPFANITNTTTQEKIDFLTYAFIVEVYVNNYMNRMAQHVLIN